MALNCLAYPSGLVLNNNNDILYVCETLKNRVLKFYIGENKNQAMTIFHQFSGKLGPMAIEVNKDDFVFIARYEYQEYVKEGEISIFNQKG